MKYNYISCTSSHSNSVSYHFIHVLHNVRLRFLIIRLELANERITFLEEKLALVTNDYKTDTETFNEIINSSKNAILQMILENRRSKCTLNVSDSLEEQPCPRDDFQSDSLEGSNNCSRIFPQDKIDQ